VTSGDPEDGFAWELTVIPTQLTAEEPGLLAEAPMVTPYRITALVVWQDGARTRRLTLSTLRLGERVE